MCFSHFLRVAQRDGATLGGAARSGFRGIRSKCSAFDRGGTGQHAGAAYNSITSNPVEIITFKVGRNNESAILGGMLILAL